MRVVDRRPAPTDGPVCLLNVWVLDLPVDGKVDWSLHGIAGWDDGLTEDVSGGGHNDQEVALGRGGGREGGREDRREELSE